MKHALIIAGAAALACAAPAFAKPGNGHGLGHENHGKGSLYGKGLGGCPPGHAKHPGVCMPHGQWKKQFNIGQRFPAGYGTPFAYSQIPHDLRAQYGLNPYGNYYYGDGHLYRVDPRTMLVQQVVSALLR